MMAVENRGDNGFSIKLDPLFLPYDTPLLKREPSRSRPKRDSFIEELWEAIVVAGPQSW